MKWMLIVIVYGTMPVETGLLYDDLDACYRAEDAMRDEYTRAFNEWSKWAKQNLSQDDYDRSGDMWLKRVASGVCIPHAG
jgi:hypothetical protein